MCILSQSQQKNEKKIWINHQNESVTLWPSKLVRQHTWHNIWNSTLLAICLNYHSSCTVRKGIVWLRQAPWICIITRRSCSASEGIYATAAWPFHHSFISQRQNISRGTHMKMCVRWRMSTVITCGCDICQLLWCDAFVRQLLSLPVLPWLCKTSICKEGKQLQWNNRHLYFREIYFT